MTDNGDGITFGGDHNVVIDNAVSDVPGCDGGCGAGIAAEGGADNVIVANSVARTGLEGIRVNAYAPDTAPAIGTMIRANLVRTAGTDGIAVATDPGAIGAVTDTLLEGNLVTGSGHDGINIASALTTVTRNLAVRNANLGIEAVPGVTDGGGNHAVANGNPAQCTNIAC